METSKIRGALVVLVGFLMATGVMASRTSWANGGQACEARCGNDGAKSLLCHFPSGHPQKEQELCISDSAVSTHLNEHDGDYCGSCQVDCEEIVCCPAMTPQEISELALQDGKLILEHTKGGGTLCCEPDTDGDGQCGSNDLCPDDPTKTDPGTCGCGTPDTDSDGDGMPDCIDLCPNDPNKTNPDICGCGTPDTDSDLDGIPDCNDVCPGQPDVDSDGDGTLDCQELCPNDPAKTDPGVCGCGTADTDSDGDGTPNCIDLCPNDPNKTSPGPCGCGNSDADNNGNGIPDCNDATLAGAPGDGTPPPTGTFRVSGTGCTLIRADVSSSTLPTAALAILAVSLAIGALRLRRSTHRGTAQTKR